MKEWNKTKIICTIGPASSSPLVMRKLMEAGMDIARINLSHGTRPEQNSLVRNLRTIAKSMDHPLGILLDIPGPKIRVGALKEKGVFLKKGSFLRIVKDQIIGDETKVSINFPYILEKFKKGMEIFLSDGQIKLKVVQIKSKEVLCEILNSGELLPAKGMNIPQIEIDRYIPTLEDEARLAFALRLRPQFLALSFIKEAKDLQRIRKLLGKGLQDISIIAKIEKKQAMKNIAEIIEEADAVMVARGDLGVEISLEELPWAQKRIISESNQRAKPVIVATQMLESMLYSPTPTRAEVTDIANAILDGTDCLMLSEETALGRFPVEAVKTLRDVAQATEIKFPYRKFLDQKIDETFKTQEAVAYASVWVADSLGADFIVVPSFSGTTARLISRFRPRAPIIAFTCNKFVWEKLNILWGVYPLKFKRRISLDNLVEEIKGILRKAHLFKKGQRVVIVASNPLGITRKANLIQVEEL